jgi:hypothetical protein
MKKCGYCGRENADSAAQCSGCGTEFAFPQLEPVVEATEIETDVPVNEEAALSTSKNEGQRQSSGVPFEYWAILGLGLGASGYLYFFLLVVILYLLLKRLQPRADWELLMVASGYFGVGIFGTLQMLYRGENALHFMEPVIVTCAALSVLYTQRRGWACFLLMYSVLSALVFLLSALLHVPKGARPEFAVFNAVFFGLGAWLIKRWLNNHSPVQDSNDEEKHPQTPIP